MINIGRKKQLYYVLALFIAAIFCIICVINYINADSKKVYDRESPKVIASVSKIAGEKCLEATGSESECTNLHFYPYRITWCESKGVCWVVSVQSQDKSYISSFGVANEDGKYRILNYKNALIEH